MNYLEFYKNALEKKDIKIGIIGLGYMGLPLALSFAEKGFEVTGFDINTQKIDLLNKGRTYIQHIEKKRIIEAKTNEKLTATSDFSEISNVNIIILCVPTPLNKNREPDISCITNTLNSILPYIKEGQLLSLESTTYPGTCDEIIKPKIESKGFVIGKNFFLCYSPEREDPGNLGYNTSTIPKIVAGMTPNCLEIGKLLYEKMAIKVISASSIKTAEFTKLLENIYRCVNISLINEMKIVADKIGVDIWEVIDAASSKPFGFTPFYPGPGIGGHCIPIDPFYMAWKAKEYGINTRFIELANEINLNIPLWITSKIAEALNKHKKSINGSKILILGITYKKNIDDTRESPAIKLMDLLQNQGADVDYCDPYIKAFSKNSDFDLASVDIKNIDKYDCAVITSDHDIFDYEFIQKNAQLIVDTRGRYKEKYQNVINA